MTVIDCSAMVELLAAKTRTGDAIARRVTAAQTLYAPYVLDGEVVSALLGLRREERGVLSGPDIKYRFIRPRQRAMRAHKPAERRQDPARPETPVSSQLKIYVLFQLASYRANISSAEIALLT